MPETLIKGTRSEVIASHPEEDANFTTVRKLAIAYFSSMLACLVSVAAIFSLLITFFNTDDLNRTLDSHVILYLITGIIATPALWLGDKIQEIAKTSKAEIIRANPISRPMSFLVTFVGLGSLLVALFGLVS